MADANEPSRRVSRKPGAQHCAPRRDSYTPAPMHSALRAFIVALSSAALLSACGKKESNVVEEAEEALPKEEQMPTPAAAPITAAADETKSNADFEAWFKKHNLDLNDPKMLDADADGDGFSNRDEFLADSDPNDPNSRPGIHKTIRLKEYTEVRLPFVLREVKGETASIEFDDGTAQREKVRKGETIKGTKLKVDRIEARTDTDKHGEKVDMSQLVLIDSDTNDRVVALKDLPTRTSASFATLVSADGKDTLKVRDGETFTWPSEPGVSYKVIDLRMDQVVVKDEASGKTITIPRQ
jgi:hypothetical protein